MLKIITVALIAGMGFMGSVDAGKGKVSDVFAAFTTELPSTSKYSAKMHFEKANLCVSFRVAEATEIKVKWKIEGEDGIIRYYEISPDENDAKVTPGIYCKCFHPPELPPGKYAMTASVKPRRGIRTESDSCRFEVSGFKEE